MDDWEMVDSEEKRGAAIVSPEKDECDKVPNSSTEEASPVKDGNVKEWVRKTSVAVAGGTMVGVGLVMIPLPTPFGAVVAGSGMAVLGTEFPAAQRVLDKTCSKVADAIERSISHEEEAQEELEGKDIHANERMKEMIQEKKRRDENVFKNTVRGIGKKAAPAIRKIGHGIDKEQLERASKNVTQAATGAKDAVGTQASRLWRHIMVLDEGEDLLSPFTDANPEQIAS